MTRIFITLIFIFSTTIYGKGQLSFEFKAKTNLGFKVLGKMKKPVAINLNKKGNLKIPLNFLTTDMEIRDREMNEKVFKNKPLLISYSNPEKCLNQSNCELLVAFKINNKVKKIRLMVEKDGNSFKGKTKIHLKKDFNVSPPERLGAKVLPEIEVEFNVTT